MSTDAPEIRAVLKTRAPLILIVAGILTAAAAAVILALPDVYVARSVVHLERRRLPKSFEQAGVVVPPLNEAIGLLRQQVLSSDVLRGVVGDLGLYESGAAPGRDPVERAREDIDIKILKRDEQEFVEISARARTGALAAQTVNRVAEVLSAKNRDLRLRLADDVDHFLEGEVAKARARQEEEDARLQRFRAEHGDSLPDAQERLDARRAAVGLRAEDQGRQVGEAKEKIAVAEYDVQGLRERAQVAAQRAGEALPAGGAAPSLAPSTPAEVLALAADLEALRRRDEELSGKYTAAHPERAAIAARIASARRRLEAVSWQTPPLAATATAPAKAAVAAPRFAGLASERAPLDAKGLMAELVALRASPDALEGAQKLIGTMAVASLRVEALEREHGRDLAEIDGLDRRKALLGPARIELEKARARYDGAVKAHADLLAEREDMRRFLDAEKAMQGDQLRTVEAASAPLAPAEPRRLLLTSLAIGAAFGLAVALAYLLEMKRSEVAGRTYAGSLEIESDLGLRTLGVVPAVDRPDELAIRLARAEDAEKGRAARFLEGADARSEAILSAQFDRLRHRVKNAAGGPIRSILVTSAEEGEGKTTVATGLARAFAESVDDGSLLIETDLRRPALARHLGMRGGRGLVDYLADRASLEDVIRRTTVPRLSVICAGDTNGAVRASAIASLQTPRFVKDVKESRPDRILVIDAPPIGATLEPLSLASLVDGIVLVVRADRTRREVVAQAIRELPEGKLLGVVLNGLPPGRDEPRLYGSTYDTKEPSRYATSAGAAS